MPSGLEGSRKLTATAITKNDRFFVDFSMAIVAGWIVSWIVSAGESSKWLILKGGSSSVVERQLPKLDVTGSIPVSRSINRRSA